MAIQRIQLRGISRTPSDRMNSDGGVAESLNTYISEAESAPVMPPEDKVEDLGLPSVNNPSGERYETTFRAVYIQRIGGEDHFIYVKRVKIPLQAGAQYKESLYSYPGGDLIHACETGVEVIDDTVTSIGNTLIFSTTSGNGYAVYRNGAYEYLGSEIPQPRISVYPNLYTGRARLDHNITVYPSAEEGESGEKSPETAFGNDTVKCELFEAVSSRWNQQMDLAESERDSVFSRIMDDFWDGIQEHLLGSQYFRFPVFVRFALRLYDGSYVYHTVPIYLGNGGRRTFSATMIYIRSAGRYESKINAGQDYAYKIMSKLGNASDYDKWKDIVQSIDMFITPPVLYPEMRSVMASCDESEETELSSGGLRRTMAFRFQDAADTDDERRSIEDALLDGSRLFYKVKSFSLDNLKDLSDGYELRNSKQLSYLENLATRETLPDDFRSSNTYTAERNYIVNRRLLSIGMTETFGRGMEALYGIIPAAAISTSNPEAHAKYRFLYEIKDNDGVTRYVYGRGQLESPSLDRTVVSSSLLETAPVKYNSDACQILFYPDTRCAAVHVISDSGTSVRLEMRSHPHLSCAYYIGDISKKLSELTFTSATLPEESRQGTSYRDSYLFQSALENPFLYPLSGRIRLSSGIIAVASISKALSEGQYGQFDLYAFTDNGIWVLTPNDEGGYMKVNPLSRDVCISGGSVARIDQAVVFITAKGVMLLDGSTVTCLSTAMTGRHYSMEDDALDIIESHGAGTYYSHALTDDTPFMNYMTCTTDGDTQIAYDYTGGRLIFFNPAFNYEYIYMLQTATWHKYVMDIQRTDSQAKNLRILNSYPDCYMFCGDASGKLYMFDWSTVLDVLDETTEVTGIIASRPFDLGEPDVLKSISHLRIRGSYERHVTGTDGSTSPRVSYILLGSQDGIHFHRIGSLRGKSWKLFRIIILSKLRPTERISWVDVEYATRFTNKIR